MFKKFQKTSFYLIFSFFAFLLASSYSKSYAGIILTPYLGAAIANYDDSNNSSGTSNKLSDVRNNTKNGPKGIVGLRIAGIVSAELEYSQFSVSSTKQDFLGRKFYVKNYGFNLMLTPPILRLMDFGLEGIIGAGVLNTNYTDSTTNKKYKDSIPKAILGARFIVFNKFAVFATSEFLTSRPQMVNSSSTTPIILSAGINIFL
jgi:hypothetical protein